jgi:branched-chain amino acid transport system ATP-binding protein
MLQTHELTRRFAGLVAVNGVSLDVQAGEIFGVIGPNGAGKTTFFNLLSGTIPCSTGRIVFKNREIQSLAPHRIARLGVGRTFQIVRPFTELTVIQNVLAGLSLRSCRSFVTSLGRYRSKQHYAQARAILRRTNLEDYEDQLACHLPLGLLRRLEIARALGLQPELILLDESFSGLSHREALSLADMVRDLRASGATILLIEHNMQIAMNLCTRVAVLDRGVKIAEGTPDEVRSNREVIAAYLGTDDHA